jgi:hypothetical protein
MQEMILNAYLAYAARRAYISSAAVVDCSSKVILS